MKAQGRSVFKSRDAHSNTSTHKGPDQRTRVSVIEQIDENFGKGQTNGPMAKFGPSCIQADSSGQNLVWDGCWRVGDDALRALGRRTTLMIPRPQGRRQGGGSLGHAPLGRCPLRLFGALQRRKVNPKSPSMCLQGKCSSRDEKSLQ